MSKFFSPMTFECLNSLTLKVLFRQLFLLQIYWYFFCYPSILTYIWSYFFNIFLEMAQLIERIYMSLRSSAYFAKQVSIYPVNKCTLIRSCESGSISSMLLGHTYWVWGQPRLHETLFSPALEQLWVSNLTELHSTR